MSNPSEQGPRPPSTGPAAADKASYRVLTAGQERVVADASGLAALVDDGLLTADSRVRVPGASGWSPATAVPEVAALLEPDDPWAAWDALDAGDAPSGGPLDGGLSPSEPTSGLLQDDVSNDVPTDPGVAPDLPVLPSHALSEPSESPVPELPDSAVRTVPAGKKKGGRFVIEGPRSDAQRASSRPASPQPVPPPRAPGADLPMAARSDERPKSNIIAFPSPQGPSTLGPHALAPLAEEAFDLPVLQVPSRPEPRTGGPRFGLLALVGFVCFGLVGIVNGYVRHVAGQTYVPSLAQQGAPAAAEPVATAEPSPSVEPTPTELQPSAIDPLDALDAELRGRLRPEVPDVTEEGDLESALFVELSRMGLAELTVSASVTGWTGKKRNVPQSAEVVVGFRSRAGELDRELAAVGLVVGRAIQSLGLELARFEVHLDAGEAGVRRWPIDPDQARNYYVRRTSLESFLLNMREKGGR